MSAFEDLMNAVYSPEDRANFKRAGREEGAYISVGNFVSAILTKSSYTKAEIATAMEAVLDELWEAVEND